MKAERFPAVVAAAAEGRILADNAAGTQVPDAAIDRVRAYLERDNAQKGSIFARQAATTAIVAESKAAVAELVGAPAANVGVGLNATSIALSISRLVASTVKRGDRVVVTAADHEANVAPWLYLRRFGVQVDVAPVDANGDIDEAKLAALLERGPVLAAFPWASNATGTVYDVARYARMAKAARATVVVDGVQAFPHLELALDPAIDFAFFSGYKMYAPHVGFWYASEAALERFVRPNDADAAGGDARVWTLEGGTQSHEGLAGWLGTVAFLRELGGSLRGAVAAMHRHEMELAAHARRRFAERAPAVRLYGRPAAKERLPVFAFNVRGVATDDLAARLWDAGIEARAGDYYAPRLMAALAPEAHARAVRLSLAVYNTREELDRCFAAIDAAAGTAAP